MGNWCMGKAPPSTQKLPLYDREKLHLPASPFSLKNEICLGECVSVYDGDTARFNIQTSIGIHQWAVRFSHYDAPEIKGQDVREKIHARACRDLLKELILGKVCVIRCGDFEKYGRLLGEIYIPYVSSPPLVTTHDAVPADFNRLDTLLNIQNYMLTHTPSQPYEGGKKQVIEYQHFQSTDPRYPALCTKYEKEYRK